MSVFDPKSDELPPIIPIFPLSGALLLPQGVLPLNIFEPRYINMISEALRGERLIGMIQPKPNITRSHNTNIDLETSDIQKASEKNEINENNETENPDLFLIGCAGKITRFEETDDGRYLITLRGITRFKIEEELSVKDGFRRIVSDWKSFISDFEQTESVNLDTKRLLTSLKPYFKARGIEANWDVVQETPGWRLINSLSMICPFEPLEKQALLEAQTLTDRLTVLTSLIEMSVLETSHEEHGQQ